MTKTVPVDRLQAALKCGLAVFGENRVQEADAKAPALVGARWALIGRLQTNKTRRAVELFDAIESVDSIDLAQRLGRIALETSRSPFPVYLQVNVDADPAKSGFTPGELLASVGQLTGIEGLRIGGLMTVGRLVESPEAARPTFTALRELSARLRSTNEVFGAGLSMGMSDDFDVAVEEGATVVRLGRVLFGERPTA